MKYSFSKTKYFWAVCSPSIIAPTAPRLLVTSHHLRVLLYGNSVYNSGSDLSRTWRRQHRELRRPFVVSKTAKKKFGFKKKKVKKQSLKVEDDWVMASLIDLRKIGSPSLSMTGVAFKGTIIQLTTTVHNFKRCHVYIYIVSYKRFTKLNILLTWMQLKDVKLIFIFFFTLKVFILFLLFVLFSSIILVFFYRQLYFASFARKVYICRKHESPIQDGAGVSVLVGMQRPLPGLSSTLDAIWSKCLVDKDHFWFQKNVFIFEKSGKKGGKKL